MGATLEENREQRTGSARSTHAHEVGGDCGVQSEALSNGCLLELLLDVADRLAGTVAELLCHLRALQGRLALGSRCVDSGGNVGEGVPF